MDICCLGQLKNGETYDIPCFLKREKPITHIYFEKYFETSNLLRNDIHIFPQKVAWDKKTLHIFQCILLHCILHFNPSANMMDIY